MISDFIQAVRFLTLLPLPGKSKTENLARSMFFFPLVGFLIGMVSILVIRFLSLDLFIRLEALALVTFPILLSGGFHLDGFADFSDGFFGGKDRDDVIRIMKDSRIGVWGVLGVVLVLFWKWELLASLSNRTSAVLLSLTASRWAQVALSYFLPPATPGSGLGAQVAKNVKVRELAGATAFLTVLIFFLKGPGIICFLALLPFLAALGFLFYKRLGGLTGDLLGAASELTELFILVVFYLMRTGLYR